MAQSPAIGAILAAGQERIFAVEILSVEAEIDILAEFRTIAGADKILEKGPPARHQERALRFARAFGNDINNTIDGVSAPKRPARPAHYFNTVNILQQRVLYIPKDAGEKRRVKRPSIHQDEQFVSQTVIKASGADGPGAGIDLRHLEVGRQPQRLVPFERRLTPALLGAIRLGRVQVRFQ